MKKILQSLIIILVFLGLTVPANASPLAQFPDLYVTLNGDVSADIYPGFGILEPSGIVIESNRLSQTESGNSFSAFGITANSNGDYWTSSAHKLIRFDPLTGAVLQSFDRVDEAFLHLVFTPSDTLLGWANGNGYLYEIIFNGNGYTEVPLSYVGLNAGGLTEMAFSANGDLFGIDNRNKRIITIDQNTGNITTIKQLPWGGYIGLAFAPDNTFFTTNSLNNSIIQFDISGNTIWSGTYTSSTPIMGMEFASTSSPTADSGDDQVVFDEVTLDGSGSSDTDGTIVSFDWVLQHREDSVYDRTAAGVSPIILNLEPGFYDVILTVTDDDGLIDTDTMLLAAAGPCVCTASKMHIQSIITRTAPATKNKKYGKVTVTIYDDCGGPVSNASVTGTFTGSYNEQITATTGLDGTAVLITFAYLKKPSYTFCVDDVNHGSLTYDSSGNVETCKSK